MKRFVIVMIVAISAVGIASAQRGGWGMNMQNRPAQQFQQVQPKAATIEGKLVFIDEEPAVETKDKTYYIHWQRFYFDAYNNGIKEGAQMKLDGYELAALPGSDKPSFVVTKAVVNGKTYDFTTPGNRMGGGMMGGYGRMDNFDQMGGGRGRR
jgi:hypothetical protein